MIRSLAAGLTAYLLFWPGRALHGPLPRPWAGAFQESAAKVLSADSSPPDVPRLTRELLALGPDAIPELISLHARHRPGRVEHAALIGAIRAHPWARVREVLSLLCGSDESPDRQAALGVLAELGGVESLRMLMTGAASWKPDGIDPVLERAFRAALADLLREDPDGVALVSAALFELPAGLYHPAIAAMADSGAAGAPEQLARLLGREAGLDPLVLRELRRAVRSPVALVEPIVLGEVRFALRSPDPVLAAEAVTLAIELGDVGAAPRLVECLLSEDHALRELAHRGLLALTGARLPASPAAWSDWLDAEREWWRSSGGELLERIASGEPALVIAALRSALVHPLFRDQLVPAVLNRLDDPSPEIVQIACGVLGQLHARDALPALEALARHEDARVCAAAARAIRRILGERGAQPWRTPGRGRARLTPSRTLQGTT